MHSRPTPIQSPSPARNALPAERGTRFPHGTRFAPHRTAGLPAGPHPGLSQHSVVGRRPRRARRRPHHAPRGLRGADAVPQGARDPGRLVHRARRSAGRQAHAPPKAVVITFDDGRLNQYTNAIPVLKKLGFTATFFPSRTPWTATRATSRGHSSRSCSRRATPSVRTPRCTCAWTR
ncbi:MAG: polysaccharide deacetylase family protein [Gemmatimonadetes bacterium]|nr:polysaccharide deacetylase family protein [Gemmatimonadota bacterium]